MIKKFLNLNGKKKTMIILPLLILSNIPIPPNGIYGAFAMTFITIAWIFTAIMTPIVFVLPIIYGSKKAFWFYLYFFTNAWNIFITILTVINTTFNINQPYYLVLPVIGISLAFLFVIVKRREDESLE